MHGAVARGNHDRGISLAERMKRGAAAIDDAERLIEELLALRAERAATALSFGERAVLRALEGQARALLALPT